jgi:hypothetical protein
MSLSYQELLDAINQEGIEHALSLIEIQDIEDRAIRTILHVLDNSLDSLITELEELIEVEKLD